MNLKNVLIILFFIFLLIFSQDIVSAKEVAKVCNYTITHQVYKDGTIGDVAPAQENGTIELKIFDDGSQLGEGKSNGTFLGENFGGKDEEILNWSSAKNGANSIKGKDCPSFIGVIVSGFGDRQWYGFTSETIKTEAPNVADYDNSDKIWIFQNDKFDTDSFTCEYDSFSITTDLFNNNIYMESNDNEYANIFYIVSDSLKEYWLEKKSEKKCSAIYSCLSNSGTVTYYYLYQDKYSGYSDGKKNCELRCLKNDDACIKTDCPSISLLKQDLDYYYYNYKNSKDVSYLIKANNLEVEMHAVCNSMLDDLNYNEPCVSDCLELYDYIKELKKKNGISTSSENNICGFSEKLLLYIANIVKWVKYIIPVIVIVLGILDFIKAIASEKDDEMKKAQGSFVKRLIAAALIFIIPFIIEFILDKMGFDANGCGIIDL